MGNLIAKYKKKKLRKQPVPNNQAASDNGSSRYQQLQSFIDAFEHEFYTEYQYMEDVLAGRAQARPNAYDALAKVSKVLLNMIPFPGTTALGMLAESLISQVGISTEKITNAYELWQQIDPHLKQGEHLENGFLHPEGVQRLGKLLAYGIAHSYEHALTERIAFNNPDTLRKFARYTAKMSIEALNSYPQNFGHDGQSTHQWQRPPLLLTQQACLHYFIDQACAQSTWGGRFKIAVAKIWLKNSLGVQKRFANATISEEGLLKKSCWAYADQLYQGSNTQLVEHEGNIEYPLNGIAQVPQAKKFVADLNLNEYKPSEVIETEWLTYKKAQQFQLVWRDDICAYIESKEMKDAQKNKKAAKLSFREFIKQKRQLRIDAEFIRVICMDDLSWLELCYGDFSKVDFSGSTFRGDFSGVDFSHARLVATRWLDCKFEKNAFFINVDLSFAFFSEGTNLSLVNLRQADCSFASLRRVILSGSIEKTMGTKWTKTDLTDLIASNANAVLEEQIKQNAEVLKMILEKRKEIREENDKICELEEKLQKLEEKMQHKFDQLNQQISQQDEKHQSEIDELKKLVYMKGAEQLKIQFLEDQLKTLKMQNDEKIAAQQELLNQQKLVEKISENINATSEKLPTEIKAKCDDLEIFQESEEDEEKATIELPEPVPITDAQESKMEQQEVNQPLKQVGLFSVAQEIKVDQQQVNRLLKFVAQGEQNQAEALIEQNKDLLLAKGTVTDLSERTFNDITAFQYAVWALDWHMWKMLLKYLPEENAAEQLEACPPHAISYRTKDGATSQKTGGELIQDLVDALQTFIDKFDSWKNWDQREKHWQTAVGGAHRFVPVHVVNEYCRSAHSLYPCPDFKEASLPRNRQISVNTPPFIIVAGLGTARQMGKSRALGGDRDAVSNLLSVRTQQLEELQDQLRIADTHQQVPQ